MPSLRQNEAMDAVHLGREIQMRDVLAAPTSRRQVILRLCVGEGPAHIVDGQIAELTLDIRPARVIHQRAIHRQLRRKGDGAPHPDITRQQQRAKAAHRIAQRHDFIDPLGLSQIPDQLDDAPPQTGRREPGCAPVGHEQHVVLSLVRGRSGKLVQRRATETRLEAGEDDDHPPRAAGQPAQDQLLVLKHGIDGR